ncbi:hypothetical protein DPMN_113123, partial [Dreissena polymorpha]
DRRLRRMDECRPTVWLSIYSPDDKLTQDHLAHPTSTVVSFPDRYTVKQDFFVTLTDIENTSRTKLNRPCAEKQRTHTRFDMFLVHDTAEKQRTHTRFLSMIQPGSSELIHVLSSFLSMIQPRSSELIHI